MADRPVDLITASRATSSEIAAIDRTGESETIANNRVSLYHAIGLSLL